MSLCARDWAGGTGLNNWLTALYRRLFSRTSSRSGKPALAGDTDPELREIFLTELEDISKNADKALAAWRADFTNPAHSRALMRAFHTLKGSAPVIGAHQLADLGRAAEQTAKRAGRKRNPDLPQIEALAAASALLPQWLHAMRHNQPAPDATRKVISALQRAAS